MNDLAKRSRPRPWCMKHTSGWSGQAAVVGRVAAICFAAAVDGRRRILSGLSAAGFSVGARDHERKGEPRVGLETLLRGEDIIFHHWIPVTL
jgi:hypothetical protein